MSSLMTALEGVDVFVKKMEMDEEEFAPVGLDDEEDARRKGEVALEEDSECMTVVVLVL